MTKHSIMQEGVSGFANAYCTHTTSSLRSTHDHSVSILHFILFITLILSYESLLAICYCGLSVCEFLLSMLACVG